MSTATTTETLFPFTATFPSMTNVVESCSWLGIDLSYNPDEARRSASYADRRNSALKIFITGERDERGETKVYRIVRCELDGCLVVTRWSPFHACLDDAPLSVYLPINAAGVQCELSEAVALKRIDNFVIRNDRQSRRAMAKLGFVVGKI
jgi:hypothetical protein